MNLGDVGESKWDRQIAADAAVERYRPKWVDLPKDEMALAYQITISTEYVGGRSAAAKIMEVTPNSMDNYRSGATKPNALGLFRLDQAARIAITEHFRQANRSTTEKLQELMRNTPAFPAGWTDADEEKLKKSIVSSYDPDDDASGNGWTPESWTPRNKGARPELDVRLGAGEGQVGEVFALPANGGMTGHRVVGEWLFPDGFLTAEMKASAASTIIMELIGDSMIPTYQPGDRVIVDLSQRRLVADTVYAISDGSGEPQIKRLQKVPFSDPPRVRIVSDNPALDFFEVELERLTILGRICGVIARR